MVSNYCNCYYVVMDGRLENTGEYPFLCDEVAEAIGNSQIVEEVTDQADVFHGQLGYEVRRNDCRLYLIRDGEREIVVAYYGHRFE